MSFLWLLPAALCLSFGLTWLVKRYALARRLVDVPNKRSSHRVATARGGGFAIVLAFLCVLSILSVAELVDRSIVLGIFGGGGLVALIGFIDDHRHIAARWRLLLHFMGAVWAICWLGGAPTSSMAALIPVPLWVITILAAVCMVWLVNLYNFMDGIDGIASIEAMTVCFGGALLYFLTEPTTGFWIMPALLSASVAGFLYWNYPPARIFMGDTGSGFLGFVLGVFCIHAASISVELFWAWIILLGIFIVDSTVTLLRRLLRAERVHEAHCSHGYQHAARKYGRHEPVSLATGAINLFWLLPLALLVAMSAIDWPLGILIAYIPLLWLAFSYRSGAAELSEV